MDATNGRCRPGTDETADWVPPWAPERRRAPRPGVVGIIAAEPETLEDASMLGALLRLMLRPDLDARVKKTLGYLMFEADALGDDRAHLIAAAGRDRAAGEFRPRSVVGGIVTSGLSYLVPSIANPGGPLPAQRKWPYPLREAPVA